ncbi:MAG TPA: permease-like cell division protein FtsX [Rubrobacter sp.]|jgi:cell division transport system permease protein|nr:permease-like cell division protein FtsX [Rubrobacter sp.]
MRFNLGFFLMEALKNLRLNILMSITAVTTTFICILVFGLGLLVSAHIQSIIGSVREDVSVEAFMPNATSQEVDSLANDVETWPEVASVTRVSEEQAFAEFKDKFKDQPDLYEDLDLGVFPPSIQIQLVDPNSASAVAERLKEQGFTEGNLSYPQQTIDRLNSITSYVIWGLYGATLLFLVASVLLISNAIRLSIFARRKEIEVMKLVGASDGFVRTPFVFEGLLQAFAGASLAAFAVIWINLLFVDWSHNALPYVPISNGAVNAFSTLLLLIAVGVGIGVIGSFLSVTRFLKKI